jgi:hypothetical protein
MNNERNYHKHLLKRCTQRNKDTDNFLFNTVGEES